MRLAATLDAWRERLPSSGDDLWDWLVAQDTMTLLALLAAAAGQLPSLVKHSETNTTTSTTHRLAAHVGLDMRGWWDDYEGYFSRVSASTVKAAVSEACGAEALLPLAKHKKATLVGEAARAVSGTGWLPKVLRLEVE